MNNYSKNKEYWISVENLDEDNMQVNFRCQVCGRIYPVKVKKTEFQRYLTTPDIIQRLFPSMKPEDRELFLTSICPTCFDKMFESYKWWKL